MAEKEQAAATPTIAKTEKAEVETIVMRRFGSRHDKRCERPTVLTCAMWECQERDRCRYASDDTMTKAKGIAAA